MNNRQQTRLKAIRDIMRKTNTDLISLGPGAHMKWVLGFHPHPDERPTLLLIGKDKEAFLVPSLNAEDTKMRCSIPCYEWVDEEGPNHCLNTAIHEIGSQHSRIVAIDETMRADFAKLIMDVLPDAHIGFAETTIGSLRMKKDLLEYQSLKENAAIADEVMQIVFASLKPDRTETEVAKIIQNEFEIRNAAMKFAIVASGPNGALPHHHPSSKVLTKGDSIVVDIGGQKGEYSSDITRVANLGKPSDEYMKVHSIVDQAVKTALNTAKPGVKAKEVDQAARKEIASAGFGKYFVHRTGHGLGIEVHEPPYITASSKTVLETGMVFSIEPGIYIPGKFGVRLEEIVILREDGPEILSGLSRDCVIV